MAAKKKTEAANRFPKATEKDFTVIVKPLITEKTMALMQNENKVTVKVLASSYPQDFEECRLERSSE